MAPDFPPGSIGAINAGCNCQDEDHVAIDCPLHGVSASIRRAFDLIDTETKRQFAERKARARGRLWRSVPTWIILCFLPAMLDFAFPVVVAESFMWGGIVGFLIVQWCWWRSD